MTKHGFQRRGAIFFMIGLSMLGACGGSSDSAETELPGSSDQTVPADQSEQAADSDATEAPSTGIASGGAPGGGGASVSIDGTVHEFSVEDVKICLVDEIGIFRASIANSDFTQTVDVSLPPEGFTTDDPLSYADQYASVTFVQSDGEIWLASAYESDPLSVNNRNIPGGKTQVDSYDFDASGASGAATFLNTQALTITEGVFDGDPVSGSFAISCG